MNKPSADRMMSAQSSGSSCSAVAVESWTSQNSRVIRPSLAGTPGPELIGDAGGDLPGRLALPASGVPATSSWPQLKQNREPAGSWAEQAWQTVS